MTLDSAEERFCADCVYLVGVRSQYVNAKEWRCHAKQNVVSMKKDQVSGGTMYSLVYETCYDARRDDISQQAHTDGSISSTLNSCGQVGAWFERYTIPEYVHQRRQPKTPGAAIDPEQLLKELE